MPAKKAKEETTEAAMESTTAPNISEIDLRAIPVTDLLCLRDRIDEILAEPDTARMGENDLLLEYDVKIRSRREIKCRNNGSSRLNGILGPRMIAMAPGRLEAEFESQVFSPLNADMYDLLEDHNNTCNKIRQASSMMPAYIEHKPIFDPAPQVIESN